MPKTARFADGSIRIITVLPDGKKMKKTFSNEAEYDAFMDNLSGGEPATASSPPFETDANTAPSRRSGGSRSA